MANSAFLIGVDLGTSAVKTTLFDVNGKAWASAIRTIHLDQPGQGIAEQDPEAYCQAALDTFKEVLETSQIKASRINAIAFDGQMGGALAVDKNGRAITPWYPSGLDERFYPYQSKLLEKFGNQLIEMCGDVPIYSARIHWWKYEQPEIYKQIHKVLILSNYVAASLAQVPDKEGFIDPSYLTWSGLSDTKNRTWSDDLIHESEIDKTMLPRIVNSTDVVGYLSKEAAFECGLQAGTPLVAGAGDQVAGFLGAGLVELGDLVDVAGTFPVLGLCHNEYFADSQHQMLKPLAGPLSNDHWYPMMYINGGGLTHRWFAEQLAEKVSFELLDKEAKQLFAGADNLLFIPHFMGRACPIDTTMRGAFIGLSWTHTKAHMYRAILESIAYDFATALSVIKHYLPDLQLKQVRVIGGGARSQLWNQIKANVLGLPYVRLERHNIATWGSAIMAGYAVGIFEDMAKTAKETTRVVSHIEPNHELHLTYQEYIVAYQQALTELKGVYQTLAHLRARQGEV